MCRNLKWLLRPLVWGILQKSEMATASLSLGDPAVRAECTSTQPTGCYTEEVQCNFNGHKLL